MRGDEGGSADMAGRGAGGNDVLKHGESEEFKLVKKIGSRVRGATSGAREGRGGVGGGSLRESGAGDP